MQKKDIVIQVVLSIVTCGIYGLFWFVSITDDTNTVSEQKSTGGWMAVLLTLITCGIYGLYWAYKMGEKITAAKRARGLGLDSENLSVLYLVLQLFGLMIVNQCLMQNELNSLVDAV